MTDLEKAARAACKVEYADVRIYGDEICCQFGAASRRREGGHDRPDDPGPLCCCWEDFTDTARAVIEAIRVPSEGTERAMGRVFHQSGVVDNPLGSAEPSGADVLVLVECWQAGIDSILKE